MKSAKDKFCVGEIFTEWELARMVAIYNECAGTGEFNRRVVAEVIEPLLPRIELKLGQQMDARWLGYAIEYAILKGAC